MTDACPIIATTYPHQMRIELQNMADEIADNIGGMFKLRPQQLDLLLGCVEPLIADLHSLVAEQSMFRCGSDPDTLWG